MPALQDVADELDAVRRRTVPELEAIDEPGSLRTRGAESWSRKQVLGHLVDSALNNLHRFVRAQQADELVFPGYEQRSWVDAGGYADRPWRSIVSLWSELNAHVAHVVSRIPPERLATLCRIGDGPPVTLEFIARDYVKHLQHHLEQILDPGASLGKKYQALAEP
ncbi:MAG TPA: DinB family protein [Vicinamibacteria bacterium]|nr:DinB family protein [Vicinamibacteria bacterium]